MDKEGGIYYLKKYLQRISISSVHSREVDRIGAAKKFFSRRGYFPLLICLKTLSTSSHFEIEALVTTLAELSRQGNPKYWGGHGPPGPPSIYLPDVSML